MKKILIKYLTNEGKKFEYNVSLKDETLSDLMERTIKERFANNEHLTYVDGKVYIRYIISNNLIKWYVSFDECKVEDFVNTYGSTINLRQAGGLGAIINPVEIAKYIYEVVTVIINVYEVGKIGKETIDKLSNWAKKFFDLKTTYLRIEDLEKLVRERNLNTADKLQIYLNIDNDCAKVLMHFLGYLYDQNTRKYYYSQELRDENFKLIKSLN